MKLMKRKNIYQSSNYNVTFDPVTLEAYSYKWWKFVAKIEGKVIFNNYSYSISTSKHQRKVRSLLDQLGIKIDIFMPLPQGINSSDLSYLIETSETHLCNRFLSEKLKAQDRYQRQKQKRLEAQSLLSKAVEQQFNELKSI